MKNNKLLPLYVALLCSSATSGAWALTGACTDPGLKPDQQAVCNSYCNLLHCADPSNPQRLLNKLLCAVDADLWRLSVKNAPDEPLPCLANPSINVIESVVGAGADGMTLPIGTTAITYQLVISNNGNVALNTISVAASQVTFNNCPPSGTILLPNNPITCTSTAIPVAANGSGSNQATVSAIEGVYGLPISDKSNQVSYVIAQPPVCPCVAFWTNPGSGIPPIQAYSDTVCSAASSGGYYDTSASEFVNYGIDLVNVGTVLNPNNQWACVAGYSPSGGGASANLNSPIGATPTTDQLSACKAYVNQNIPAGQQCP